MDIKELRKEITRVNLEAGKRLLNYLDEHQSRPGENENTKQRVQTAFEALQAHHLGGIELLESWIEKEQELKSDLLAQQAALDPTDDATARSNDLLDQYERNSVAVMKLYKFLPM